MSLRSIRATLAGGDSVAHGEHPTMYLIRYVMSRIFVFWLSIAILVYGWFSNPQLVNTGFGTGETL